MGGVTVFRMCALWFFGGDVVGVGLVFWRAEGGVRALSLFGGGKVVPRILWWGVVEGGVAVWRSAVVAMTISIRRATGVVTG